MGPVVGQAGGAEVGLGREHKPGSMKGRAVTQSHSGLPDTIRSRVAGMACPSCHH